MTRLASLAVLVFAACNGHREEPRAEVPPAAAPPEVVAGARAAIADQAAAGHAAAVAVAITRAWRAQPAPADLAPGRSWVAVEVDLGASGLDPDHVDAAAGKDTAALGDLQRLDQDGNRLPLYGAHANETHYLLFFDLPASAPALELSYAGTTISAQAVEIAATGPTLSAPSRKLVRHFADGKRHVLLYEDDSSDGPPSANMVHVAYPGGECAARAIAHVNHALEALPPPVSAPIPHALWLVDFTCAQPPTAHGYDHAPLPPAEPLKLPQSTLDVLAGNAPGVITVPATTLFTRVAVSADGKLVAGAPIDGAVHLFDRDGKPAGTLPKLPDGAKVVRLGFASGSARLWLAIEGGDVLVYDVAAHTQVGKRTLTPEPDMYARPAVSPDGRVLAVDHPWYSGDSRVAWGGQVALLALPDLAVRGEAQVIRGNDGSISAIAVSPDGKHLAVCAASRDAGIVRFYALPSAALEKSVTPAAKPTACAFASDGRLLVGDGDGDLTLYDRSGAKGRTTHAHGGGVDVIAVRADGTFATGGADGRVLAWPASGDKSKLVARHLFPVNHLEVAPGLIASSSNEQTQIVDLQGKLLARLVGATDGADDLAIGPGIVVTAEMMIEARETRLRIWRAP